MNSLDLNRKAMEHLENNDYDTALALFKEAVQESRDVQSLTNLAWILYHEESDSEAAIGLAAEAIELLPSSHFPYNLLGEIFVASERWEDASHVLSKSIAIEPSKEAYTNLAIANYHLGNLDEASTLFLRGSEPSDYAMYSHVKCLIELGKTVEAICKLNAFSESDDEFVGEVEVAELYIELQHFSDAIRWFDKSWPTYYKSPDWVCRYIYALIQTRTMDRAIEIANECIQLKTNDIQDELAIECDEDWTENEKAAYLKQLEDEKLEYENMINKISLGYVPPMEFSTSLRSRCYLFGCTRHDHHEYMG